MVFCWEILVVPMEGGEPTRPYGYRFSARRPPRADAYGDSRKGFRLTDPTFRLAPVELTRVAPSTCFGTVMFQKIRRADRVLQIRRVHVVFM